MTSVHYNTVLREHYDHDNIVETLLQRTLYIVFFHITIMAIAQT